MRLMPFEFKFTHKHTNIGLIKKAKMIVLSKSKTCAVKIFKQSCKDKGLENIEITKITNLVDECQLMLF